MPSSYIEPDEYAAYGLPDTTTAAAIQLASILVDSCLKRPEGVVYDVDSVGNPLSMSAATASATFTTLGTLAIGSNLTISVSGPLQTLRKGTVLIADRANPANAEALTVSAFNGAQLTFAKVTKAHASGILLESGLFITESKHLPTDRMSTVLSRSPLVHIFAAEGKYGPSRRGRYAPYEFETLAQLSQPFFSGGASISESIVVDSIDFVASTSEVWLPSGLMAPSYTDVTFQYLAGFSRANIPGAIKQATANLTRAQAKSPLAGNIKVFKSGDTQIERFLSSLLSNDEVAALQPYRARSYA